MRDDLRSRVGDSGKLKLLTALSGFGILLVVIGHAEAAGYATLPSALQLAASQRLFCELVKWFQTFHMPLFFFVSGYLLFHATLKLGTRPYEPVRLVAAKAQRLLVPYWVISSVAYLPKVWLSRYALRPAGLSLNEYVYSLLFPWNNAIIFFWFLPTLFLMFCAAPWLLSRRDNARADACLLVVGALLCMLSPHENFTGVLAFLNLGGVLHNIVFFSFGFIACKRAWLTWFVARRGAGPVALAVSIALFVLMRDDAAARLCLAIAGIALSCAIASSRAGFLFLALGRHSFEIYLFSWFPQTFVKIMAARMPQLGWSPAILVSIIAGLFVPIVIAKFVYALLPSTWHYVFGGESSRATLEKATL